jgi:hypothetical protein
MKADININTVPITFQDTIYSDKMRVPQDHVPNKKFVFVDTDNGQLYSADYTDTGFGTGTVERNAPYNQSMPAKNTTGDASLACDFPVFKEPQGKIDVYVNGLSATTGPGKDCYFSADNGITAKVDGEERMGDKLFWNGLISGYDLETTDKIDFDYIITTSGVQAPTINLTISGNSWGTIPIGVQNIEATTYDEPPLESWKYYQTINDYIELMTSESSTDLIEMCRICVGGIVSVYTLTYPIGPITHDQKKIVDDLFREYTVNGVTLLLERGNNWPPFSL